MRKKWREKKREKTTKGIRRGNNCKKMPKINEGLRKKKKKTRRKSGRRRITRKRNRSRRRMSIKRRISICSYRGEACCTQMKTTE
jgi:hypothetical protein